MKASTVILAVIFATAAVGRGEDARFVTITTSGTATNQLEIADWETAELYDLTAGFVPGGGGVFPYVMVVKDSVVCSAGPPQSPGSLHGTTVRGPATFYCFGEYNGQTATNLPVMAAFKMTPNCFPPDKTVIIPPGTNQVQVTLESG
jgi:hypothetical protein